MVLIPLLIILRVTKILPNFEPVAESYILRTIDLDHSPTCTLEGANWPNADYQWLYGI